MSVIEDCTRCDGRPGGCRYCGGFGIEPPTAAELDRIKGDALRVLNNDGRSHQTFSVIDGGKSKK